MERTAALIFLPSRKVNVMYPVLFMRTPKVNHFRQPDDPLAVFELEGITPLGAFSLTA